MVNAEEDVLSVQVLDTGLAFVSSRVQPLPLALQALRAVPC